MTDKAPPADETKPASRRLSYRALQFPISPRLTLQKIRRYSIFVAFMKGALPTAALALGIAVLAYTMQPRDTNRMALTFERTGEIQDDLAMVKPRLTGTDDDGNIFIVTAASATQESRGSDSVRLQDVVADITLKEGTIHVTAAQGVVDTRTRKLAFSGGIRLTTEDGYDARAPSANADLKAGTVSGSAGIEASGAFGNIKAQRFSMNRDKRQLLFTGNVQMLLNGAPPKK